MRKKIILLILTVILLASSLLFSLILFKKIFPAELKIKNLSLSSFSWLILLILLLITTLKILVKKSLSKAYLIFTYSILILFIIITTLIFIAAFFNFPYLPTFLKPLKTESTENQLQLCHNIYLKISASEYTKKINSVCQKAEFTLKIKNVGKKDFKLNHILSGEYFFDICGKTKCIGKTTDIFTTKNLHIIQSGKEDNITLTNKTIGNGFDALKKGKNEININFYRHTPTSLYKCSNSVKLEVEIDPFVNTAKDIKNCFKK